MGLTTLKGFDNGLTIGLSGVAYYNFYESKPGQNAESAEPGYYGGDARTQWGAALYPFAEYAFNDTWQLRTVFGWFNWRNVYGDENNWRLIRIYDYQSVGVGYAATRDIYIYPNIQFVPSDTRGDFTNVAISATINMF